MSTKRQYDIVLFGATGYTGKLTAEHIATHLPTDLKWAIAGRSESKLEAVAAECKALNPDRSQPSIEIASLNLVDLDTLAAKTTLMIATVGPYAQHGEAAFRACAENGTHYLDTTGEVAWVSLMIKKYEAVAKKNNCIMIPQCGLESAPPDLCVWAMAKQARERHNKQIGDTVISVHEITGGLSGGTIATVLGLFDVFSLKDIAKAGAPYGISPIPGPNVKSKAPWSTTFLGIRNVSDLGTLTTSPTTAANAPVVQRTWGLFQGTSQAYGDRFYYSEYMKARNAFLAVIQHLALTLLMVVLLLKPVRLLLAKVVTAPGSGPDKKSTERERVEYRGTAEVEGEGKAFVRASYEGGLYYLTGVLLAQAAITILHDETEAKKMGGILTPACLGQAYVDRLRSTGFKLDVKMLK